MLVVHLAQTVIQFYAAKDSSVTTNIPDKALLVTYDSGGLIDTILVRGDVNYEQAYSIVKALFKNLDLRLCKSSSKDYRARSLTQTAVEDQYGTKWFCFAVLIKPNTLSDEEEEDEE